MKKRDGILELIIILLIVAIPLVLAAQTPEELAAQAAAQFGALEGADLPPEVSGILSSLQSGDYQAVGEGSLQMIKDERAKLVKFYEDHEKQLNQAFAAANALPSNCQYCISAGNCFDPCPDRKNNALRAANYDLDAWYSKQSERDKALADLDQKIRDLESQLGLLKDSPAPTSAGATEPKPSWLDMIRGMFVPNAEWEAHFKEFIDKLNPFRALSPSIAPPAPPKPTATTTPSATAAGGTAPASTSASTTTTTTTTTTTPRPVIMGSEPSSNVGGPIKITGITATDPGVSVVENPDGSFTITGEGGQWISGLSGYGGEGAPDTSPPPNSIVSLSGGFVPESCKNDSDCAKYGKTTCNLPTKTIEPITSTPAIKTQNTVVGGGTVSSSGWGVCSGKMSGTNATNKTYECNDPSGICIVTPKQKATLSLKTAMDVAGPQLQILSKGEAKCQYSTDRQNWEYFLEDQAGVSVQHTIYLYYLKLSTTGVHNVYYKCVSKSGETYLNTHTLILSDSGRSARLVGSGTQNSTVETIMDSTGKESFKITPNVNPEETTDEDTVEMTLVIEEDGEPVKEVPLTAEVIAESPAPSGSNAGKIAGTITVSALLLGLLSYLVKLAIKSKKPVSIKTAYPTVNDQIKLQQSAPKMSVEEQNRILQERLKQFK